MPPNPLHYPQHKGYRSKSNILCIKAREPTQTYTAQKLPKPFQHPQLKSYSTNSYILAQRLPNTFQHPNTKAKESIPRSSVQRLPTHFNSLNTKARELTPISRAQRLQNPLKHISMRLPNTLVDPQHKGYRIQFDILENLPLRVHFESTTETLD
ncbi:hypothetical protein PoB_000703000 [Plakobranchus ocellatus]|uniref:Uncharacterized protein n=1 Tax=Plakobranchus ocellatus TaxID=259542 RepID=A0AAV3YBV9_9GAST|nr:hypothetical protein PoB_000703000 [Plakobranchus ocellatus]